MDRHEWGDIHFYLSLAFLTTMLLHVVLHWAWVQSTFRKYTVNRSLAVLSFVLVLSIGLLILPFVVPIDRSGSTGEGHGSLINNDTHSPGGGRQGSFHIRGSITLAEIEAGTGIPASDILKAMNLPDDFPRDGRIGRMLRDYNKDMEELRSTIDQLLLQN